MPLINMILFICTLPLAGCSVNDDNNYNYASVYEVKNVEVVDNKNLQLRLKVSAVVPNPCHMFSHFKQMETSRGRQVEIFSKIEKDITCIQVLGEIETEIILEFPKAGKYMVGFQGRSANLDTVFNVIE